ncbi:MAG: electron transfer flavoprotein subunit alpha/FixB family protein [Thermodesulfobacteriota bacterium]
MALSIFALIGHKNGAADDSAFELAAAAKAVDSGASLTAVVCGAGSELDSVCQAVSAVYPTVWKINHAGLAYPNAEALRPALAKVIPKGAIVLMAHDTLGMDLGPGLSIKLDAAFVPDVVGIEGLDGNVLKLVRQEFGGQVSTHIHCDIRDGAVINVRSGAFQPTGETASGSVVDKSGDVGDIQPKRKYLETVVAEVGDVDITKADVLVSVGRGIEDQENISIAQELADTIGAVVSCSRPIVDAKWLEKSRQVGTSGKTVKPKVYIALGISGSFQHLGGIKGNPFMVAINKNPKAPIFQVADVGVVTNLLEFVPELTERIKEKK